MLEPELQQLFKDLIDSFDENDFVTAEILANAYDLMEKPIYTFYDGFKIYLSQWEDSSRPCLKNRYCTNDKEV